MGFFYFWKTRVVGFVPPHFFFFQGGYHPSSVSEKLLVVVFFSLKSPRLSSFCRFGRFPALAFLPLTSRATLQILSPFLGFKFLLPDPVPPCPLSVLVFTGPRFFHRAPSSPLGVVVLSPGTQLSTVRFLFPGHSIHLVLSFFHFPSPNFFPLGDSIWTFR